MKTYKTQQIAQQIATRLSKKGTEHTVVEHKAGEWAVVLANAPQMEDIEQPQHTGTETGIEAEAQKEQPFTDANTLTDQEEQALDKELVEQEEGNKELPTFHPNSEAVIQAPKKVEVKVSESITVTLPVGSYEKGGYVYTPAIDGKPRWFATKGLLGLAVEDSKVKITITRKALKARGLTEDMLAA